MKIMLQGGPKDGEILHVPDETREWAVDRPSGSIFSRDDPFSIPPNKRIEIDTGWYKRTLFIEDDHVIFSWYGWDSD